MVVKCPQCSQLFDIEIDSIAEAESCTLDCPHCNILLLCKGGELKPFHQTLHEQDPRWPADGGNTGFITCGEPFAE